ncbi:hypothetical protein [Pararobbsia silviterrae]|uniref:Uncharacterized protein n=1 Tax=Pararobbsia silviterrae TaxID=1792498 RepID=A0A494YD88_9BURK|nr:hypothetical protein [Pararobbsia silviterrae]RKP58688.1 hypothetical protein D7S86_01740 [Pararobbsia silviterrae]
MKLNVPQFEIQPHSSPASMYDSLPTTLDQSVPIAFSHGERGFVTLVHLEPRFYTLVINQAILFTGPALGIIRQIRHYEENRTVLPTDDDTPPRERESGDG